MFRPDSNRDRTDYGGILMPPDGYRLDRPSHRKAVCALPEASAM